MRLDIPNGVIFIKKGISWERPVRIALLTGPVDAGMTLTAVEALALWNNLGALLDEVQPGATGLRPLPDGDPAEVDAMILREAADKLRRPE